MQLFASMPAQAGSVEGHLEEHTVASKIFGEDRHILVWLPESYASDEARRFPLLLALQGENLFDVAVAAGGDEWAVDELLVRSPAGIPEFIVVGIVSAANAVREYATPGSRQDAQAEQFLRHVRHEILPYVERIWRIDAAPESRYLMGMGNSALTAIYGAWIYAGDFAGALAFDLPDVDTEKIIWQQQPPADGRPWLWLEQMSSERSRRSNTALFAALQRASDVRLLVAGPEATHPTRLAAALRATPLSLAQPEDGASP